MIRSKIGGWEAHVDVETDDPASVEHRLRARGLTVLKYRGQVWVNADAGVLRADG